MEMVIFGASGGIGQYLIKHFRNDHKLFGTFFRHDPDTLETGSEYFKVNISDREAMNSFISKIISRLTHPVLIYTPGISPNNVTHNYKDEDWDQTLSINLTGAMLACRGILPRMREVGFGRIVFMSSVLSRISVPGTIAYSATKAALGAMARVIAVENAKKGITANTLALGYHNIGIIREVPEPYLQKQVLPSIPQGKLGDPINILHGINFILQADYLTGATIDINGGIISV